MGRHVSALQGAGPLYARDLLSAPLRKLEETISMITTKHFMPDQSRSGMFTPAVAVPSASTPVFANAESNKQTSQLPQIFDIKDEAVDDVVEISDFEDEKLAASQLSATDSENSLDTGPDDEDEQLAVVEQPRVAGTPSPVCRADGRLFFMHKKSKICHFGDRDLTPGGGPNFLECGRMLSDNFISIVSISSNSFRCGLCFRNRPHL